MCDTIKFYIREDPYGFLSNFWRESQVDYSNEVEYEYSTNEHYYQSMKAKDHEMAAWIRKAPSARLAMEIGRSLTPEQIKPDWNIIKVGVMKKGLMMKFTQNSYLEKALLMTGNDLLIEDSPTDMFWGGRLVGS